MFSVHLKELKTSVEAEKYKSPIPLAKPEDTNPSPKTKAAMKRVTSMDNFIKFQWPWIL